MQFLKILFWVLIAVLVTLFARANWTPVTLNLWDGIQADIKLPLLFLIAFLIGWLPMWLVMRARMWSLTRRLEAFERHRAPPDAAAAAAAEEEGPVI